MYTNEVLQSYIANWASSRTLQRIYSYRCFVQKIDQTCMIFFLLLIGPRVSVKKYSCLCKGGVHRGVGSNFALVGQKGVGLWEDEVGGSPSSPHLLDLNARSFSRNLQTCRVGKAQNRQSRRHQEWGGWARLKAAKEGVRELSP